MFHCVAEIVQNLNKWLFDVVQIKLARNGVSLSDKYEEKGDFGDMVKFTYST